MSGGPEGATGDGLLALLELERLDDDRFAAPSPAYDWRPSIFGGQVAAQAIRAAGSTVDPDRRLHSFHSYFLRPGRPGAPVALRVERRRDGRSFTTREVTAEQDGQSIFTLSASFHVHESGPSRQLPRSPVPDPHAFDPPADHRLAHDAAFDVRLVNPRDGLEPIVEPEAPLAPMVSMWIRARPALGEDSHLHASVLAYISDLRAGLAALVRGQRVFELMMTSLDHAMWFHRPLRADDWMLVELRSVSTSGSRGLVLGTMHDREGVHGVSFCQESLVRTRRSPG